MTTVPPSVLKAAKAYEDVIDQIAPKFNREIRGAADKIVDDWTKAGTAVTGEFINGLLNGVALVQAGDNVAAEGGSDPFGFLKVMLKIDDSKGLNVAILVVGAIARSYVETVDPEALEQ